MHALDLIQLGVTDYSSVFNAMRVLTDQRDADTIDQLWITEHHPVFTQGLAGKSEHILDLGHIPLVQTDRGGQITYHAPGQLVVYLLLDLKRRQLGVRTLVTLIEQSIIHVLADYHITAYSKAEAPGVYVRLSDHEAKIAQLGLRVRRHCSYHGLSLNINMDTLPFTFINPCGYAGLAVTDMQRLLPTQTLNLATVANQLIQHLQNKLMIE